MSVRLEGHCAQLPATPQEEMQLHRSAHPLHSYLLILKVS